MLRTGARRSSLLVLSLLIAGLTVNADIACALTKTVAERLGYPADSKLLIIMGDDVGFCHSVNRASLTALNQRSITSGTVIMASPWLTEVALYAKQHAEASLGVHLTLSSENKTYRWGSVASKEHVPSLLDPFGYLYPNSTELLLLAKPEEVEREIRVQIDRALQFGFRPDFVDSFRCYPTRTSYAIR